MFYPISLHAFKCNCYIKIFSWFSLVHKIVILVSSFKFPRSTSSIEANSLSDLPPRTLIGWATSAANQSEPGKMKKFHPREKLQKSKHRKVDVTYIVLFNLNGKFLPTPFRHSSFIKELQLVMGFILKL